MAADIMRGTKVTGISVVVAVALLSSGAACSTTLAEDASEADGGASAPSQATEGTLPPSSDHHDGIKNGDETDVDCGGATAPRCSAGKSCTHAADCVSAVCDPHARTCASPTSSDGVKNGDESDVDCGGTTTGAPRCAAGKTCNMHADCKSDGCDYTKRCALAPSCAAHHGGDTCGPDGAPESCCTSLPVPRPGAGFALDKYTITAGRMREFIGRTGGNVRGWMKAHKPSWWEDVWDDYVPTTMDDGTYVSHEGAYQELGPGLFYEPFGGNMGCQIEAYGARTFRLPDDVNRKRFDDAQPYDQDVLDEKAQQCATFFMFAAFCAWDGGRLPTLAELNYAWNGGDEARTYPWGAAPAAAGYDNSWASFAEATSSGRKTPALGDLDRANFSYNWWTPASRACGTKNGKPFCDYSVHIAPPGRFPAGNGPFGHADLGGLVYNMTADITGAPGTSPQKRKVVWARNGSWQGHPIPAYQLSETKSWKAESKYWATGARCAR